MTEYTLGTCEDHRELWGLCEGSVFRAADGAFYQVGPGEDTHYFAFGTAETVNMAELGYDMFPVQVYHIPENEVLS